jgi:hypothetical protein
MSHYPEDRNSPLAEFSATRQVAILLGYFAHFHHPLKSSELALMLSLPEHEVLVCLMEQSHNGLAFCCDEYWSNHSHVEAWVAERKVEEERALQVQSKLPRIARRVARFPFVEAVAISGSLSKGRLKPNGDVDFFVVTKPGRLWICRSLLIAYKKLVLLNSRKWLCLNYLIDLEHLRIPDQNLFTAVEIKSLRPMWERGQVWNNFYQANQWHASWLKGNYPNGISTYTTVAKKEGYLERLLSLSIFDSLERYLHRITLKRWQRKFSHHREQDFQQMFRSTQGVSKHHPQNHQSKSLDSIDALFFTPREL